jgi:hypothetical protein
MPFVIESVPISNGGEKFYAIRGTTMLDLSDGVKYSIISFDGFGMAPVKRLEQSGPMQNGATDLGYRLQPRNIRLAIYNMSSTIGLLHDKHHELLSMFRPGNDVIKFKYVYADLTTRQIDCYWTGGLQLSNTDLTFQDKFNQRAVIELRAPDPTWYDPTVRLADFALSASSGGFVFPLTTPFLFGSTTLNQTVNIQLNDPNAWDTYPTIYVTGAAASLKITNTTTGDKIDFGSNTIGTGVTYTIDTRYGYKTIVDGAGANQLSKLTNDSNLATWRLVPGDNSINVTGTGLDSNSRIFIQYNTRYIGV